MKPMKQIIRIGTRRSALALAQTSQVVHALNHAYPGIEIKTVEYVTSGDRFKEKPLSMVGGKGLFTLEIEEGLKNKEIDLAVHSMKDFPVAYPEGLVISAVPPRESPLDVLLINKQKAEENSGKKNIQFYDLLPTGARIGTTSLRRSAQLKIFRPDIQILPLRGNITTRIEKLEKGLFDAIILAEAGLNRLGISGQFEKHIIPLKYMLPAIGQGALALECRENDLDIRNILQSLNDEDTYLAVMAERAFLKTLGGGCNYPVAAYGEVREGMIHLEGMIMNPQGSRYVRNAIAGLKSDTLKIGNTLAEQLLNNHGREILEEINNPLNQKGLTES
jgi:hydroxymethylbilane synthase